MNTSPAPRSMPTEARSHAELVSLSVAGNDPACTARAVDKRPAQPQGHRSPDGGKA
ncbi:hypothetical protein [Polaromonas sp. JS666]|uniref:hypothetical protein n=1 Tax=Polaromonas sp. (strain JS666 / ATCC BAA-500) TaxID=296591 RepID=UPI0012ED74A5|nr:hypothetical protein [Polaromonas sp. JS666]